MSSNAKTTLIESVPKITDTESQKEVIDVDVPLCSEEKVPGGETSDFLHHLWKEVNNDNNHYIQWNKDGTGILVHKNFKGPSGGDGNASLRNYGFISPRRAHRGWKQWKHELFTPDAGKKNVALISQQKKANMNRKRNRVSEVTDPIQVLSSLREQNFADSERPEKRPRRKININLKDSKGETALSKAISKGNLKIISKLLENGADPNIKVKGIPALLYCNWMWTIKERTTFIHACLKAGVDHDVRSSDGKTLLMIACEQNYSTIVDELLKINADQHLQDKNGKSALMYAVEKGDEKIVQLLLTETEK